MILRSPALLRGLIDVSGLTMRGVAERAGISHTTLSLLVNGHRTRVTSEVAESITGALDVDVLRVFAPGSSIADVRYATPTGEKAS